jgi:Zinc carboxypeptidase
MPVKTRFRSVLPIVGLALCLEPAFALSGYAQPPVPSKRPSEPSAAARAWPLTRPEATRFAETSRYDDVMAFMKAMAAASPQIHLTTYGYTFEGRALPLAVIGAADARPETVRATGKTRIYIQGNIHAGEVEGKEALLWLLRSMAKGERAAWLNSVVLLINPIYNADGNERVNVRNRGRQNGPVGGMGQRHNAQDLDLNRDCTKLETAEDRSLARLMTQYDPHIAIDLHTTDGSAHGFYLTYQTSVSPNTSPGLIALARRDLFPWVTRAVKAKHGWDCFYYGNISRQGGEQAWSNDLDLYKPRYTQTYFGIRNRLGILVETYAYATFEDRIKATYWFLEEVITYAAAHGETIRKTTAAADAESIIGTAQAVRGKLVKAPEPVQVVMADTVEERNPYVPDVPMLRRANGTERIVTMPHFAVVEPTETSVAPRVFVLPAPAAGAAPPAGSRGQGGPPAGMGGGFGRGGVNPLQRSFNAVVDRLEAHGVKYTRTDGPITFTGERFAIEQSTQDAQEFRGAAPHKLRTLTGAWEATEQAIPAGSLVVPMDQPLARLAFILFDPRSDDGLMAWNILDGLMGDKAQYYPVLRSMQPVGK